MRETFPELTEQIIVMLFHTCTPVSLFHPDVTIGLGYASLRVQERHEDAALGTEASVVAVTLLHGISVILLSQAEMKRSKRFHLCHAVCFFPNLYL